MQRFTPKNGFTLVELAIALMVIGLLIGGVLKGQELIGNAKATATMRQITSYRTATMIFRNTYNAFPGDIKTPERVPDCASSPCNIAGNGNGALDPYPVSTGINSANAVDVAAYNTTGDRRNFFLHMAKAGMISGDTTGAVSTPFQWGVEHPASPYDGSGFMPCSATDYGTPYNYDGPVSLCWIATLLSQPSAPTRAIAQIDTKMDDGKPYNGDFIILYNGSSAETTCVTNQTVTGEYAQASTSGGCQAVIKM